MTQCHRFRPNLIPDSPFLLRPRTRIPNTRLLALVAILLAVFVALAGRAGRTAALGADELFDGAGNPHFRGSSIFHVDKVFFAVLLFERMTAAPNHNARFTMGCVHGERGKGEQIATP